MARLSWSDWREWTRIAGVCTDADDLPRVGDAGATVVEDGVEWQIMHNGLKVLKAGYAMGNIANLIWMMKGVHEPQEEKCFFECLKYVKPGGTMVELGSNWSFYSMWFAKAVEGAQCHCLEADLGALELGMRHFAANGLQAIFTNAQFGDPDLTPWGTSTRGEYLRAPPDGRIWWNRSRPSPGLHRNVPLITLDHYVHANRIEFLDLLHSDIQEQELNMLQGAKRVFEERRVGFVFVSTHSDKVHGQCRDWLEAAGYGVIAEHSRADSFSGDGLIVAKNPDCPGPQDIPLSRRTEVCQI